jgi:hypothetical protein
MVDDTVSRDAACSASAVDPLGSSEMGGAEGVTAPSLRQQYADEIYDAIKHGDYTHRQWLRDKLNEWARTSGTNPK